MDVLRLDDLTVHDLIGFGESGRVFQAEDREGERCAFKVLDEPAINRNLLGTATRRLAAGGWPQGVMPVRAADFGGAPACLLMPLVADENADGVPTPRSLQHKLDEHPGIDTWKTVRALARALAAMHEKRVAHGNLKPGNVFVTADGGVLVADWALGNMPGISVSHFTDAILYQPPEQLLRPGGYVEEEGYRWDVYAFGALAFRLLSGRFPRCNETFLQVAPPPGGTHRDGIHADLAKVARNVAAQREIEWPDEPANPLEAGLRGWIDRCLLLDPAARPSSMAEVDAGFETVERDLARAREMDSLLDQRRRAERATRRAWFLFGGAVVVAVGLAGLWQLAASHLARERSERGRERIAATADLETAVTDKERAEAEAKQATNQLEYERDRWLARLEASRLIGDRLFEWALEKGHRSLPPLDGRELRLKRLQRYFEDFLTRTADIPELKDEQARVKLELAEVMLAAGEGEAAGKRLAEALDAWESLPMDADFKLRIARNSLLLALLRQANSDPATAAAFEAARKAFAEVPRADVDVTRLDQLMAILDFHEAQLLAAQGEDRKALEQLMTATQTLNRIADERPDSAVLRSELAACYLSSATILEGIGSMGDAREVRSLAAGELTKLLEENPRDPQIRLNLAGCYGAMAEAAVMSGDVGAAASMSEAAMKLLDDLLVEQPDHVEASARKAAQLGLRAGILRDRGEAAEALKLYDMGIAMLERIRVSTPDNSLVSYRIALLWWQKARMLGMDGQRDQEVAFIRKARDLLGSLEIASSAAGPRPEQLQLSSAYMAGDLGHSLQLSGKSAEAANAFAEAVTLWERLVQKRPNSEEYTEGLAWCRQRLEDLR